MKKVKISALLLAGTLLFSMGMSPCMTAFAGELSGDTDITEESDEITLSTTQESKTTQQAIDKKSTTQSVSNNRSSSVSTTKSTTEEVTEENEEEGGKVTIDRTYVSLGANLSSAEKTTVLKLLGISQENLEEYNVIKVTNADEHEYLDDYLDAKTIGTRALSSVMISKAEKGDGITVDTENINYCTQAMYVNALITAGVEDANVKVVGPFPISGTAGLVGVMKAYEKMTGEEITDEVKDAATNELVTTGELSEQIGSDDATKLLGLVKQRVVEEAPKSEDEIIDIIEKSAKDLDIKLTDSQEKKIAGVMDKIKDLDIDTSALKKQAKGLYDKLKSLNIDVDSEEVKGFFTKIADWFKELYHKIFG